MVTTRNNRKSAQQKTRIEDFGSSLDPDSRPDPSILEYQELADTHRGTGGQRMADFLGFFSLGLGLAEVLAPRTMARIVGVEDPDDKHASTFRWLGLREIASGAAILGCKQPKNAMWSRVAGDTMDLALLGKVLANPKHHSGRTLFAIANVAAVTALDVMCARELSLQPEMEEDELSGPSVLRVRRSVTIGKPVAEVYAFWRNFSNLPRFMRHLESVEELDERRSHWVARGPAGTSVEWDAEVTEVRENELIAWRSLEESDVQNAGVVRFRPAPGGRGTEVRVELEYKPPLGKLGSKIAMLWREEPRQQVADDLRHLKQVLEVGEVLVSDATVERGPHPAQPSSNGNGTHGDGMEEDGAESNWAESNRSVNEGQESNT